MSRQPDEGVRSVELRIAELEREIRVLRARPHRAALATAVVMAGLVALAAVTIRNADLQIAKNPDGGGAGSDSYRLELIGESSAGTRSVFLQNVAEAATDDYRLAILNDAAATELVTVDDDGPVGIGTATPGMKLDVESSAASDGLNLNNTAADGDPIVRFQLSGVTTFAMGVDDGDADKMKIGTTSIDTSTRLTIDAAGNVGIGTTAPSLLLDLESAAATDGIDLNNTAATGDPVVRFQLSGVGTFAMGVDDSDADKFKIGTTAIDTSTRLTIDSSGNVGIGTTAPSARFEVESSIAQNLATFESTVAGSVANLVQITRTNAPSVGNEYLTLSSPATANNFTFIECTVGGATVFSVHGNGPILYATGNNLGSAIVQFDNSSTTDGKECLRLDFSADSTISSNDDWIRFVAAGTEVGRISDEVTYNTFTGAHEGQTREDLSTWEPGMIVCSTGVAMPGKSMGRGLVEIRLARKRKDPAAIGVYTQARFPHIVKGFDPTRPSVSYNALGEGLILVTDVGGDLRPGDLITTSDRAGYGERQDDDRFHNFTVAKASEAVDWSKVPVDAARGFKWALIACTYHSG